jgi:hypothetical protein
VCELDSESFRVRLAPRISPGAADRYCRLRATVTVTVGPARRRAAGPGPQAQAGPGPLGRLMHLAQWVSLAKLRYTTGRPGARDRDSELIGKSHLTRYLSG